MFGDFFWLGGGTDGGDGVGSGLRDSINGVGGSSVEPDVSVVERVRGRFGDRSAHTGGSIIGGNVRRARSRGSTGWVGTGVEAIAGVKS